MSTIAPDRLFVIACPVCRGQVAATASLCGRDACCPLCASLLHVPMVPGVAPPTSRSPAATAALAEDWGGVIETLAPPLPKAVTAANAEQPSDIEIPPPEAAAIPQSPVLASATPAGPIGGFMPTAPSMAAEPACESPESFVAADATPRATADWIDAVLAAPDQHEEPEPAAPEGVPYLGPTLLDPKDKDLEFREPVRTIRQGDAVIEIRRLTPEERRVRRFRRNLMMIVVCVSILMAIVVVFGVPTPPR